MRLGNHTSSQSLAIGYANPIARTISDDNLRRFVVERSGPQRPAGPVGADDDARGRGLASNQGDEPFEDHRVIVGYEDAYSLHRYEIRPSQNLTHSEDEPCASADTWPVVGMTQEVVDG